MANVYTLLDAKRYLSALMENFSEQPTKTQMNELAWLLAQYVRNHDGEVEGFDLEAALHLCGYYEASNG